LVVVALHRLGSFQSKGGQQWWSRGKLQVKLERQHGHGGRASLEGHCHTAKVGEACYEGVEWAMEKGIRQEPDWYPGLNRTSSFEDFQAILHESQHHHCPAPCKAKEYIITEGRSSDFSGEGSDDSYEDEDLEEAIAARVGSKHSDEESTPGDIAVTVDVPGTGDEVVEVKGPKVDVGDEGDEGDDGEEPAEETAKKPAEEADSPESRGQSGFCWTMENGYDYPGGDLRAVEDVASADTCCQHCRSEPRCRQWTHSPSSRKCVLKRQQEVKREPHEGLMSGLPGHDNTTFLIRSHSGPCLDVSPPNGLRLQPCNGAHSGQQWVYDRGTGEIYSRHGVCLDAPKWTSAGGHVRVRLCSAKNSVNQQWKFDSSTGHIQNVHSHCLAAVAASEGNGSKLSMRHCDASSEQVDLRWSMSESAGHAKADAETDVVKEESDDTNGTTTTMTTTIGTTVSTTTTSTAPPLFVLIKEGSCADAGLQPILTRATCETAAQLLGLSDTTARLTNNFDRPEGCYVFEMNMLWMGVNPKSAGRGCQPFRNPICMRSAPAFEPDSYVEQHGAGIEVGGDIKLYAVGSSNLVWMNWIDQLHLYLQRLGYRLPLVPTKAILSRSTPRSVPTCDDSAYFAKLRTARLGMVGWNSWDFAYDDFFDCDKHSFRKIGGHNVKCSVGPGCKGGKFLINASNIAEDAAKSHVTLISTWYNDHKAFLTKYACFDGEKLDYENTSEVTIPTIIRMVKEIHSKNPKVWILVMGLYPPTLNYKVVDEEVVWIQQLNDKVREAVEKQPRTYFVDFEMPGHGLEMYDRVHYGHPNCRGAKVMVYATLKRLFETKVLARSIRIVNPKENLANEDCEHLEGAACGTSALCWVDPAFGKCRPYSAGHLRKIPDGPRESKL